MPIRSSLLVARRDSPVALSITLVDPFGGEGSSLDGTLACSPCGQDACDPNARVPIPERRPLCRRYPATRDDLSGCGPHISWVEQPIRPVSEGNRTLRVRAHGQAGNPEQGCFIL